MIDLSIVILSWNTRDLLQACLESLFHGPRSLDYEVIVVDNASEDGSADMTASRFPRALLIRNDRNEGYARGNNLGILRSKGRYILLLNSDTEVRGDAPERMTAFLEEHPEYGACAPKLVNPDGTIQRACMRFPTLAVPFFFDTFLERLFPENRVVRRYFMRDFDHTRSRDVEQPPGSCFLFRSSLVSSVGLLDEDLFLFYNDVDYCKRIREAGLKIRYIAEVEVMHHLGGSTRKYGDFSLEWHKNRVRYFRKHHGFPGAGAAKCGAILRAVEEVIRCRKAGCALRSPEVRHILGILREVLKS